MRLHVGCGKRILEGWINVDIQPAKDARAPEILADLRCIPLPDGCASELMAIHVLEHMFPWEAPAALTEWFRLLAPGGSLVLEMPDLLKACANLLEGRKTRGHVDQLSMWPIYGDDTLKDPFMMHKTGWWFERLKPVVESAGFIKVVERETQFHPAGRGIRDFRLEALKPI